MGDLDAVGEHGSKERNLAYSIVGDIENKFIFRTNHQEATALGARLNIPPSHIEEARRLRMGVFLAYIGQHAYAVDCFATSTSWEYDLFATDHALTPTTGTGPVVDPGGIELAWPTQTHDAGLEGWLTPTGTETP